jgi:polyhydroxyalkanoate synthesis regulator phasin
MADPKKDAPLDLAGPMESAFLMGVGVFEITREKVGGMTDELIERGRMSDSEAKRVAQRISDAAATQQEALRKTVSEETGKAVSTAGLATHEEIAALRSEIADLRAMLSGEKPAPKPRRKPAARKAAPKKPA